MNVCGGNFWNGRAEGNEFPPEFPEGATKHIGEEVFYTTGGDSLGSAPYNIDIAAIGVYFGPTADQALNPMPNKVEQNIIRQAVCKHVESEKYASLYEKVWGVPIDCTDTPVSVSAPDMNPSINLNADPDLFPEKAFDISFKRLMLAVCAWQHSKDLNSFSSKRDKALREELACLNGDPYADPSVCSDEDFINSPGTFPLVGLTDEENLGHDLFYNSAPPFGPPVPAPFPDLPVTNCSFCHCDNPTDDGTELEQQYADDAYHNIGVPPNPEIPPTFKDGIFIDPDLGIAGFAGDPYPPGFHKTTGLRNVNKRPFEGFIKAYTHNGWFKSMESIVHFYNTAAIGLPTANSFGVTRCVDEEGNPEVVTEKEALARNCWPAPAYPGAPFGLLIGNMGMDAEQEAAIVAYLKTLTDEHTATAPKPYTPARK